MSKFKKLTSKIKDYISRQAKVKEEQEYTWKEVTEDFNKKW